MPDSLLFDGTDDEIVFSVSGLSADGALTGVVIFKLTADAAVYKGLVGFNTADWFLGLDDSNPGLGAWYPGNGPDTSTFTFPAASGWMILAYSKPDGSAVSGKWHKYVYGGSWTHEATTSPNEPGTAVTQIRFGKNGDGGSPFNGSILIAGWWNSELSDGTIESLSSGKAAWTAASPAVAWRLDTMSTITAFAGTSTETSRVGTSLDTGDAPAGWTDEETTPQVLAPSADSVDGNWTNQAGSATDLFDSINETTASDTDYIRSELSPANSATRIKLASGGDPQSSTGHEINWRIAKDAAGGQTIGMTVKLYQGGGNSVGGGTLIASFTRSNVTNTFTDFAEALSGAEADSITNYADLYLEFWANAT